MIAGWGGPVIYVKQLALGASLVYLVQQCTQLYAMGSQGNPYAFAEAGPDGRPGAPRAAGAAATSRAAGARPAIAVPHHGIVDLSTPATMLSSGRGQNSDTAAQ